MWLKLSGLLPLMYLTSLTSCVAVYYQRNRTTDYATSKWREKLRSMTTDNPLLPGVRIRHSRFPNLDRVSNRLDDIQASSRHRQRTATTTTTTTTDEGLLDDYEEDDLNYEDDEDVFDKENEDDDMWMMNDEQDSKGDDFLDYEEDDPVADYEVNEEEEEAEEQQPVRSPLTEFKWKHYGTRSRVEESRRNQMRIAQEDPVKAVVAHTVRVNSEGKCKRPSPKVIPVQNEHPDVTKTYIPHCTILHRCADDTGCCNRYGTRCLPKTTKPVHLYFYTKIVGQPGNHVERLRFENHTECACLEDPKLNSTSAGGGPPPRTGISVRSTGASSYNLLAPESIRRCRCPGEFIPRLRPNMTCICDCSESNYGCQRMKKGKEHFSLTDRRCILDKECGVPNCEYGSYLKDAGRCPRKQEN